MSEMVLLKETFYYQPYTVYEGNIAKHLSRQLPIFVFVDLSGDQVYYQINTGNKGQRCIARAMYPFNLVNTAKNVLFSVKDEQRIDFLMEMKELFGIKY